MSWRKDYGFLEHFWQEVIEERAGTSWLVSSLFDGDVQLRDGLAHALVRNRLQGRQDIRYHFTRAWFATEGLSPPATENLLFVGRPKAFTSSTSLSLYAIELESNFYGQFQDFSDGTTSNTIVYDEKYFFTRHELEPHRHPYRRCDVDYGVLMCRRSRTDGRLLVAIAGLGTLGTLGLMLILTDDERRRTFVSQVRELAPPHPDMRPEESFEICVRIAVAGDEQLASFLNDPAFIFRVDAVAVAGAKTKVREEFGSELILTPYPGDDDRRSGTVRLPGSAPVRLPPARFALLRRLVEQPAEASPRKLMDHLANGKRVRKTLSNVERVRLAKLVHDLNINLGQIPGLQGTRLVRFDRKQNRYVLQRARGTVM